MFWKNNYGYYEEVPDYFENKDRTNFTYAESSSYRLKSNKSDCTEPYLFRKSVKEYFPDANNEEMNVKSASEMSMRKSTNSIQNKSVTRTSVDRNDRVLRSRTNMRYKENANIPFVRERDTRFDNENVHDHYAIGSLNTNTNNSGPDELEDSKSTKTSFPRYDLSTDDEVDLDYFDNSVEFESNNANLSKTVATNSDKVPTKWLQKHALGLPAESDDIVSGTISGDDQYDIASFQTNSLNSRSKRSRKSSKLDADANRTFYYICSPLAMLSFIVEWIWKVVRTVVLQMVNCVRRVSYHSMLLSWLRLPFYLPAVLIRNAVTIFAKISDKLFGTSFLRQNNVKQRRTIFNNRLSKIVLFLLLTFVILALLGYLLFDRTKITDSESMPSDFNLSQYAYQFVGNDCMTANECCHSQWSLVRRFAFCLFSLPARMVTSNIGKLETNINLLNTLKLNTSNNSNLEELLNGIKLQLEYNEKQLSNFNVKIQKIEEDSKARYQSNQESDKKVSDLTKNMESASVKLSALRNEMEQVKLTKANVEKSLESLLVNQKEKMETISSNHEEIKLMNSSINKLNLNSMANNEDIEKLEKWLVRLKNEMDGTQIKLNEMDTKTIQLEQSNQKIIHDSAQLKENIMDQVNEEIRQFKSKQNKLEEILNNQMSRFESYVEENQSKLVEKDYLNNLLENLLQNMKKEINSSIWVDLSDHVKNVMKSSDLNQEQSKAAGIFSSPDVNKFCNCLPSSCRCPRTLTTCVRANEVRKLLKEAFELFAADKIGMADFALESGGGTILTTRCTETYTDRASTLTVFGIPLLRLTNSPRTIIQPSTNPGECWPMKGDTGSVVIQLSALVNVGAVSIDHIPRSLSPSESTDSALKEFEIKSLSHESDKLGKSLGNFTYRIDSTPVQTFRIQNPIDTKFVELLIKSNYGNKEYTCIYRFRVHGKLVAT